MNLRQALAVPGYGGIVIGKVLQQRQRPAVFGLRLRRLASGPEHEAKPVVVLRQLAPKPGDGGVVIHQLLMKPQRLSILDFPFREPLPLEQHGGEQRVPVRQAGAEVGDRGIIVDQLPQEREAFLALRLCLGGLIHLPQMKAEE